MMSNRILTIVTLVAVSFHVLLGCCWHGHHLESAVGDTITACSCPYHAEPAGESSPAQDESHDECDHSACTFYSPNSNWDLLSNNTVSWWFAAHTGESPKDFVNLGIHNLPHVVENDGVLSQSKHRRALVQVWLI